MNKEKLKALIKSGQRENIELALQIGEGLGVDVVAIIRKFHNSFYIKRVRLISLKREIFSIWVDQKLSNKPSSIL